jgi:hypothetical protein
MQHHDFFVFQFVHGSENGDQYILFSRDLLLEMILRLGVRSATIKADPGFRRDRLRASVKLACDQSKGKVRDSANELDSFETSIGAIHTKSNNLVS